MTQNKTPLRLFDHKDPHKIGKLFLKLREQPHFFDDTWRDDPYQFALWFVADSTVAVEIGDFSGIFYAINIVDGQSGVAAVAIWDKEYRGELGIKLAQDALIAAMRARNLHKLVAMISVANTQAVQWAKRTGFVVEGTIREHTCYNGKWTDMLYLGVLRSEIEAIYKEREAAPVLLVDPAVEAGMETVVDGSSSTLDRPGVVSPRRSGIGVRGQGEEVSVPGTTSLSEAIVRGT